MADLTILFDDHGLIRTLSGEMQRRLPRATAATLNKVAYGVVKDLKSAEKFSLHLTRQFVPASTQYEAARSAQGANMQSEAGILDRVYFAERLVDGGVRHPKTTQYIAVPVGVKKGKTGGSLRGQKPSAILRRKGYFLKTIKGIKGIWYANNKTNVIKLMYILEPVTTYDEPPYIDFEGVVLGSAETARFPDMILENIMRSMGLL